MPDIYIKIIIIIIIMNFLLFILITSLTCLTGFTINVNKHYAVLAGDILNLNNNINHNPSIFKSINKYNNNSSICYNFDHKNNYKYLLKDKYNYLVSFDIHKYRYLIILRSIPINYTTTELDIDIRHNRNLKGTNTILNFKNYKRIENIIYKYIYNNIIIKKNDDKYQQSIDLFKFFNSY